MRVKPYGRGRYWKSVPSTAQLLYRRGLLVSIPKQIDPDLVYDDGVNIVYKFRNMTLARIEEHYKDLLQLCLEEMERYREAKYFFVKLSFRPSREITDKIKNFTSRRHDTPDMTVIGEEGPRIPWEPKINTVASILDEVLAGEVSPQLGKQPRLTEIVICIRAGWFEKVRIPAKGWKVEV